MRRLMVSTDIGLFCTPGYMRDLYGEGVGEVEVIGWRWAGRFLRMAAADGVRPWRLHGRVGSPGPGQQFEPRSKLIQELLLPTKDLVVLARKFGINKILIHAGEARERFSEVKKLTVGMDVGIENSLGGSAGLEAAFEIAAELVKTGIRAAVVGDVGHFGLELGGSYPAEETMKIFLERIDKFGRKYGVETGAHLPINFEKDEGAINIDEVSDAVLKKFLCRFDEIVVENRADLMYEFLPELARGFKERSQRRWKRIRSLERQRNEWPGNGKTAELSGRVIDLGE